MEANKNGEWRERMDRVERGIEHLLTVSASHEVAFDELRQLMGRALGSLETLTNVVASLADSLRATQGSLRETQESLRETQAAVRDLATAQPEKVRELAALWQTWADRCGVWEWDDLQKRRQSRNKKK